LILLTMAPDADIVLRLFSDTLYLQHHRGLTHSLLMLPLWGWLAFSLSSTRIRQNPAMPWMIALALLMHIGLDLLTTFGTMLFAPISDWRASLDLLFIIDPLFAACLLLPLLAGFICKQQKRKLGVLSLLLMFSYLGLVYNNQQQAIDLARTEQPGATAYNALPLAFSPFNWQLIAIYPDYYMRASVNLKPGFTGTALLFDKAFVTGILSTQISGPDHLSWQQLPAMQTAQAAEGLPGTAFYQWFARYPVLLKQSDSAIEFGDLAFGAGAPGVHPSFRLHIDLNGKPAEIPAIDAHAGTPERQPRAWLIWRGDHKSELTQRSRPFHWLP